MKTSLVKDMLSSKNHCRECLKSKFFSCRIMTVQMVCFRSSRWWRKQTAIMTSWEQTTILWVCEDDAGSHDKDDVGSYVMLLWSSSKRLWLLSAFERRGNNFNGDSDFKIKAKAIICPWLFFMCNIRRTSVSWRVIRFAHWTPPLPLWTLNPEPSTLNRDRWSLIPDPWILDPKA